MKLAKALRRMLPSASCQGVGVLKLGVFRGSITWPVVPPVYASYLTLRSCPQDSEPVWLARPSPYGSFIHYILPVWCGLHRAPRRSLLLPSKNTVLTHRLLALRHVIPNRILIGIPPFTIVNVCIFSSLRVRVSACEHAGSECSQRS